MSQIKEILASYIDGETVMMSIENGKYYGLDDIGGCMWELADSLLERFDVDHETCAKDVLKFLNDLDDDKILQVEG